MGKVSDELSKFTETYSTILTGIHSDMTQYREEVKKIQEQNSSIEKSVLTSYKEIQRMDRNNIK